MRRLLRSLIILVTNEADVIASIPSSTLLGIDGQPVLVEVHVASGLPVFSIVGLADLACREARDRVRAAILSSGLPWPIQRITVNLAPADIRKLGSGLDLAIALGVLVANGDLPAETIAGMAFLGELGLNGSIRRIPGVVPLVDAVLAKQVVVPLENMVEAAFVQRVAVRSAPDLRNLVSVLLGHETWSTNAPSAPSTRHIPLLDLADVRGQPFARRSLEIAAAGGHHLLMCGTPGAGKTMLAQRIPGILPLLEERAALDVLRIRSASGLTSGSHPDGLDCAPPFRSPHHSTSMVALVGGGSQHMRPGELSLAHHGVLFLDELSEFTPTVLDALRQPLEDGVVRVARARAAVEYPARFQLIAATNPCPCGWKSPDGGMLLAKRVGPECRCGPQELTRMARRLSGPLLDRIDIRIDVKRPDVDELLRGTGESTAVIADRVRAAREISRQRNVSCNARLSTEQLGRWGRLDGSATRFVELQLRQGSITARGMDRLRRVARTVSDLSGRPADSELDVESVIEASELRRASSVESVNA